MPDHDGEYKNVFSHPRAVAELLRGFVRERWVDRLDFSTLEKVSASYVSERLRARHGDTVWRVRLKAGKGEEGPWLYVYLLLEFQSTPYSFMAVRMLGYVSDLLEDLIRMEELTAADPLPAVLPLVLYSGKRPWTAPTELLDLFRGVPRELRRRRPRLDYLLVDEGRLAPDELSQQDNLVAALFRVETATPEELPRRAREMAELLPRDEQPELRRDLTLWVRRLLQRQVPGVTIPEGIELEEMPMIEETLIEWREQARQEGQQEGIRQTLLQVLEQRFGRVPAAMRRRVDAISSTAELQGLVRRALAVDSLAALGLGPE